jgi:ABC-type maltose transport system permease subunit
MCRYFVVALSVSGLYSIITTLASISIIAKPNLSTKFLLHFAFWDVVSICLFHSMHHHNYSIRKITVAINLWPSQDLLTNLCTKFMMQLILGLVASATGSAGGVAYIGLKGNKHVAWNKVCNTYDKFCQHLAGSLAVSLFASFVLVLLVWLSVYTLHRRIPK